MGKRKSKRTTKPRKASLRLGVFLVFLSLIWGGVSDWYVHHTPEWLESQRQMLPRLVVDALLAAGNPIADITDGLGWTGHDVTYEYDSEAPKNAVAFAGLPIRTGDPAPHDIVILDRGPFKIGWSPSLRHAVWCAYHVIPESNAFNEKRPNFKKDANAPGSPLPDDYKFSGFDRGHLAPNFAILTRYGEAAQRSTFLMSNIAPQRPALNRGVWRDVEHRIAELWTARYGEIWVVVGCIPSTKNERLNGSAIDIPSAYYQVILAQEGLNTRALAVLFPRNVGWDAWAARHIVTIDALEEMTGLDFNPELPSFIQDPLEAELPTRLWPVRIQDIVRQLLLHYKQH